MYSSIGHVRTADLPSQMFRFVRKFLSNSFNVPLRQIPRILFHGLLLACIISGFWVLDSLKDPILANTVGIEYQPVAKLLSVVFVLFVVCIYDFMTSVVSKPSLFHIICNVFGFIVMIYAAILSDERYGLENPKHSPNRWIGWIVYFTVEAYGSLSVALFWSFTNSIMDLEQAKGAYGLIIAIAQIGAVCGSTLATNASSVGIPKLFIFGSMLIFLVSLLIKVYHLVYDDLTTRSLQTRVRSDSESSVASPLLPETQTLHYENDTESVFPISRKSSRGYSNDYSSLLEPQDTTSKLRGIPRKILYLLRQFLHSFYEGLSLIIKYPYVMKLLGVSCLYEIIVVILDYEFKLMGSHAAVLQAQKAATLLSFEQMNSGTNSHNTDAGNIFANLLGHFGQLTNLIAFLVSLFGFSYLVHRIGVQHTLMIFPIVLFIVVVISYLAPSLGVLFVSVSIIKALLFSLHDPVKELLYIPTSESIKFKAKAWIDVFGSRLAKALGSSITSLAFGDPQRLRQIGEIPALVLSVCVIILTWSIGTDFIQQVKSNIVIGDVAAKITYHLEPNEPQHDPYQDRLFEGVNFDIDISTTRRKTGSRIKEDDDNGEEVEMISSKARIPPHEMFMTIPLQHHTSGDSVYHYNTVYPGLYATQSAQGQQQHDSEGWYYNI